MKRKQLTTSLVIAVLALGFSLTGCKGGGSPTQGETKPSQAAQAPSPELAAKGEAIFNSACAACHSIGQGKRIGPDLKDVSKRRDHDWLMKWMKDPVGMGQNDPVGKKLMAEYNNVPMPNPNLTEDQVHQVLSYIDQASAKAPAAPAAAAPIKLSDEEFASAKQNYFNRCAGCHGTLRAGATGPKIDDARSKEISTDGLKAILTNGTPRGMPAFGKTGLLSEKEINAMASFLQMPPPEAPQLPLEKIKDSWTQPIPVAQRPTQPVTKRNWENYFGVVLRDAGQVAIIDGDTKELVEIITTGFAVHILRSSSSGRYFYAIGRDGKVTLIDLWPEKPQLVAQVQGCYDARSVDGSKFKGYEDKFIIEGCYWPPQYVIYDGQTLEPKKVVNVLTPTYDTNEPLKEVRVASIVASHYDPLWVICLKESGHVALVDYSKPDFPMVSKIAAERFLHDGGWDHTKRYFMVAANMRDSMAIVDVKEKKLVTKFKSGTKPHPGRGANWLDPQYGWVNGTVHIGEGKLTVYGTDPEKNPQHAWKVVREVKLPGAGGLFLKTHEKSPWVWTDSPLSNEESAVKEVCVYSKKDGNVNKCWKVSDNGRQVHFEYNKDGTEVWVSTWDAKGELVVYDDQTLTEKARIKGDWLVTPTGKFNVYNSAHDVY